MKKNELREHGFSIEERIPKKFTVNVLWFGIMVFMVVGTFLLIFATVGYVNRVNPMNGFTPVLPVLDNISEVPKNIFFTLILLVIYFALKLFLSIIFSSDRLNSVRLKILEGNVMPICFCAEALEIWQIIVIYLTPVIVVYGLMFGLCAFQIHMIMEYGLMLMTILVSFFFAFDLTLVIYLLRIKIKEKIDYIAINHHVYEMTLFKSTYVRTGNNKNQLNQLVNKKLEPQNKIKVFESVMTCINPRCENHACELEKSSSRKCPSCGKRTYRADVFVPVISCGNPSCENYEQELIKTLKECPLCGGETTEILKLRHNPGLVIPALVISIISAFVFNFLLWFMFFIDIPLIAPALILSVLIYISGVVIGAFSKSRNVIIVAIMSMPAFLTIFALLPNILSVLEAFKWNQ